VIRQTRHSTSSDISLERNAVQAISKGRHPNVVQILDTWIEETSFITTCFIQMELCQGDLAEFLHERYQSDAARKGLSSLEIWGIFRQIMAGLEYIHSQGIMHRDLKPKNGTITPRIILFLFKEKVTDYIVLYTKNENNLVWKITDFGFSAPLTDTDDVPITPINPLTTARMTRNYSAPEVIIDSRYDQKADIWSAGCILYELATGTPPFGTEEAVGEYASSGMLIPCIAGGRGAMTVEETWRMDELVGGMMLVVPEERFTARRVVEAIPTERGLYIM